MYLRIILLIAACLATAAHPDEVAEFHPKAYTSHQAQFRSSPYLIEVKHPGDLVGTKSLWVNRKGMEKLEREKRLLWRKTLPTIADKMDRYKHALTLLQ